MSENPTMYTAATLADRWHITPTHVLTLIKQGALPAFTFGRVWRIKHEDVAFYEENQGAPVREPFDVYVILCAGFVKIGKASDARRRIADIQTANPSEIETIAILTEGDGHKLERDLHRRFAEYRHRGEWFRFEGELASWVANLRSDL